MNIILITDDFYPKYGGVSHTLFNLYKAFEFKDHVLNIFNPFTKGRNLYNLIILKKDILKDIKAILIKKKFYLYVFYSLWALIKDPFTPFIHRLKIILSLITHPIDFIWAIENVIRLSPYLEKMSFEIIVGSKSTRLLNLIYILSRIFKKKVISMAHGNDFLIKSTFSFKTIYFKNIDKIIISNLLMKNLIKKIHDLDESKLELINRGVSIKNLEIRESKDELRNELNVPIGHFILVSVGRHSSRKDFALVIKAIKIIKNTRPNIKIKYFLIGKGAKTPYYKELTKDLGLEQVIEFLGPCPSEIKNKYYKLSDLFIMPSVMIKNNIEGFGIVFLEANYYKVPVIGTSIGGVREAIKNGENGLLIKPNDLKDLVDKILFFYDNEKQRMRMGENGYKRVIKYYNWDYIIDDYIRVFKNLLELK